MGRGSGTGELGFNTDELLMVDQTQAPPGLRLRYAIGANRNTDWPMGHSRIGPKSIDTHRAGIFARYAR